jgi:predicted Zn-dependent peptidase
VVSEEFKEHYLNKPYGDAWHIMREMAYTTHPYRWMTIGKELKHIEEAKLSDVKAFFFKHYTPSNAIMVVAGNVEVEDVRKLAEKWFGDIPSGDRYVRDIKPEPPQLEARKKTVTREVPLDALYKCWHMPARLEQSYYVADLIADILGGSTSSRLYQVLVKEKKLFSNIECYHYGCVDRGLLTIEGKLVKDVDIHEAEQALDEILEHVKTKKIDEKELQKVKNKTESLMAFEDMTLMNRANSLAFYEFLGDANLMNTELSKYQAVTTDDIIKEAVRIFDVKNSNTLYYLSSKK